MTEFDLGAELAHLLPQNQGGNFEVLIGALRPYLKPVQAERLDRALELAKLLKSAKQFLPKLGGALGIQ